eukprot:4496-Heterococcus_DN1.PRE.4
MAWLEFTSVNPNCLPDAWRSDHMTLYKHRQGETYSVHSLSSGEGSASACRLVLVDQYAQRIHSTMWNSSCGRSFAEAVPASEARYSDRELTLLPVVGVEVLNKSLRCTGARFAAYMHQLEILLRSQAKTTVSYTATNEIKVSASLAFYYWYQYAHMVTLYATLWYMQCFSSIQ